jgi:hypothetical protein
MYVDPSGDFAISTFLIGLAVSWAVSTVASAIFGQHLVAGTSLLITGGSAVITGLMAISLLTPVGWVVGGVTLAAGLATLVFSGAEFQEHFTGENYIKDKIGNGWYNMGLIISSTVATLGSIASGITYNYKLDKLTQTGRIDGKSIFGKDLDGYPGLRFSSKDGKVYSFEFHPNHNNHGVHIQWNQWMKNYPKYPGEFVLKPVWRFRIW